MAENSPVQRETWGNHCEFFLSSLGLAVGLGNVWRFPYVCYENGGGSFLIPYVGMLILVGLPAFFMELSLGQYSRVGSNKVFGRMVPAFKGLGYAMIVVRFFVNIYYVVITAWSLYYLAIGFQKNLPWSTCDDSYNTFDCYSVAYRDKCVAQNNDSMEFTFYKQDCVTVDEYCKAHDYSFGNYESGCYPRKLDITPDDKEYDSIGDVIAAYSVSPAEDYFNGNVLGLTKDQDGTKYTWDDYGSIQWHLVGCLAGSWVLICLSLIKGIQSYGKVAYVITLSPFVVLTILLGYTLSFKNYDGITFLFQPEWEKLTEIKIWAKGASQILFSLSVAFGSQLVLSSYNNFKNNSHRDSIIVGICNSLTSVYAGIVVFLILGFLADKTGTTIPQVVKGGGITLAFVSYPSAVLEMEPAPLWSFLFFFMLINLALSSICGGVQTFLAFILDEKPAWTKHRSVIVIILCLMFFLCGLPMCTNAGILLFTVFDKRCTSSLLFLCFLEVFSTAWVYGTENFFDNLLEMGMKFNTPMKLMWTFLWKLVTPAVLAFVTIYAWVTHDPMTFGDYKFPDGVEAAGWFMELLPLLIAILYPIIPLIRAYREGFRGQELYDELFQPSDSWYRAQMERRKADFDTNYMTNDYDNEAFELSEQKSVLKSGTEISSNDPTTAKPPPSYGSIEEKKKKEDDPPTKIVISKIDNIKLNAAEESEIQSLNEVVNDDHALPTPIETIEVNVIEASDAGNENNSNSTSEEKSSPAPEAVEINITDADAGKPQEINAQNDASKN